MVPKGKGVSIGHIENKLGQLPSAQSEIIFEDVWVPGDCLVGKEGEGFKIAMLTLDMTSISTTSSRSTIVSGIQPGTRYWNCLPT